MSTVLKHAPSLSVEDRLELIEELWDSLAATPEAIPVTDAQRRGLARRRRAHARNPSAAEAWGGGRAKLERRRESAFGSPPGRGLILMRGTPCTTRKSFAPPPLSFKLST